MTSHSKERVHEFPRIVLKMNHLTEVCKYLSRDDRTQLIYMKLSLDPANQPTE